MVKTTMASDLFVFPDAIIFNITQIAALKKESGTYTCFYDLSLFST